MTIEAMSLRYGTVALGLVVLARLGAGAGVLPASVIPVVVFLAIVGFPLGLAVAWMRGETGDGSPSAPERRLVGAVAGAALLALAAWVGLRPGEQVVAEAERPELPAAPRVVVLPLIEIDGAGDRYFADGLTGELVASLVAIDGLEVAGRASAAAFIDVNRDPAVIGRRLGGDVVLDGTVRRSSGRLRIGLRLVDATTGTVLWSASADTTRNGLFGVRDDVVREIAAALGLEPTDRTLRRLERRRTSLDALDLYMLGRSRAAGTRGDLLEAASYQHLAIEADSAFAPAWAALAEAYATLPRFTRFPPARARREGAAAARTALQLDPDAAAAHAVLGEILYLYERDWSGARSHLERAAELDPGAAAPHERLCELRLVRNELEAATASCAEALALDPLAFRPAWVRTGVDRATGNFDRALVRLDSLVQAYPDFEPVAADLAITRMAAGDTLHLAADLAHWFGLIGRAERADSLAAALIRTWPPAAGSAAAAATALADIEAELDVAPVHVVALRALYGDVERAAEVALAALAERAPGSLMFGVYPEYAMLREREEVRRQLVEAGLPLR